MTRISVGVLAAVGGWVVVALSQWRERPGVGLDYRIYLDAAERWLAGGSYFQPGQLAPGHVLQVGDVLYPPVALVLFVPFTVLPAVLWWIVPIGLSGWVMARLRPAPWTWPCFLAIALFPRTPEMILFGNPGMWAVAFLSCGVLYGWPAVLVLLKFVLAPFALIGIRRRSWWITLVLLGAACVPFGRLWADYLKVLETTGESALYTFKDMIPMLAPIIAWIGRDGLSLRASADRLRRWWTSVIPARGSMPGV